MHLKYSGALIIRTKIRENCVQIKQNVRIIQTSKSMGKHTIVQLMIVRISEDQIIRAILSVYMKDILTSCS